MLMKMWNGATIPMKKVTAPGVKLNVLMIQIVGQLNAEIKQVIAVGGKTVSVTIRMPRKEPTHVDRTQQLPPQQQPYQLPQQPVQ